MDVGSQVELWAIREFGGAQLGDERRAKRLVDIAVGVAESPGRSISGACGAQAVSRLFDRPETTVEAVLKTHKEESFVRCAGEEWVFAVQDTTYLDFGGHKAVEGLGPIGTSKQSRGLLMHTVLAVTPDKIPLGILGLEVWARKEEDRGSAKARRRRAVRDKESQKWLDGLKEAEGGVPQGKRLLVIGDRESGVFALFAASRGEGTDLLARVAHNRAVEDEECEYLREALEMGPALGEYEVEVPRQGSRARRKAKLEVRGRRVVLKPPRHKTPDVPNEPVEVWLVRAVEMEPPDGIEGVDWILLTTKAVDSLESAIWTIKAYTVRWVIEEFHYVLKSGCKVERLQLETVDRLAPAITVNAVVGWRVLQMTKLSRGTPDAVASRVCSAQEVSVLERWLWANKEKLTEIRTVRDFVRGVALLGGFMGRRSDGEPGVKTVWRGLRRLEDLVIGYSLATAREMR